MNESQTRRILALILCVTLAMVYKQSVWDPYFSDNEAPDTAQERAYEEVSANGERVAQPLVSAPDAASGIDTASKKVEENTSQTLFPTPEDLESAGVVEVQTENLSARITLLGGRFSGVYLNHYKQTLDAESGSYNLVGHVPHTPLPLGVKSGSVDDRWVKYSLVEDSKGKLELTGGQTQTVALVGLLPDGRTISKNITFLGTGYLVDVAVLLDFPPATAERLELEWTRHDSSKPPSFFKPGAVGGYSWFTGESSGRDLLSKLGEAHPSHQLEAAKWVSVADSYFVATIIAPEALAPAEFRFHPEFYSMQMSGGEVAGKFRLYLGPLDYQLLESVGDELQRSVDFGYAGVVSAPMLTILHFLFGLFHNYGLAIVSLTILVKCALYPLNSTAFRQMKAMQDLKPEMDKIRSIHKNDREKLQQEMMGLYKKKGVNPLGGCLPMLLQMPIFIGLFFALRSAIELRHAPFAIWIHDLSAPESVEIFGYGIPIMVILLVLSMLVQQWTSQAAMEPAQKRIMMVMTLFFGVIFVSFPAGLTLYYLTNNIISIVQQKVLYTKGRIAALKATGITSILLFSVAFALTKIT